MPHPLRAALMTIALLSTAPSVFADVTPASPFTDHMVLQQGPSTAIFGTAAQGEAVTVTLNGQTVKATANDQGRWIASLANLQAGGPFTLTFAAANTVTLNDVYVGEVWLASGQSNMDFTLVNTPKYRFAGVKNMDEEVKAANYPLVRMYKGEWQKSATPKDRCEGQWKVVTPDNAPEMSAVAYFFARDLHQQLNVPVGIVVQTFGASCAEAWVSREALEAVPEFRPWLAKFDDDMKAYAAGAAARAAEPAPATTRRGGPKDPSQDQHNPTVMYNGMIHPILPFTFKGLIWYQGESIAKSLETFPKVNETLVADWRKRFDNPTMPFYFCQLAGQDAKSNRPEVREAQAQLLKVPNTAMAVLSDIGERKNVHPKNKQDVGDRLARIALAKTYGKPIEYSGPAFDTAQIVEDEMRLTFTHATGGLLAKSKDGAFSATEPVGGFELAGPDGKFFPAKARIDGKDAVILSSPDVPGPQFVRYAWSNFPDAANLYNGDKLPAAQFRAEK